MKRAVLNYLSVVKKTFDNNNKRRYNNNGSFTLFYKRQRYIFCQISIV